MVGYTNRVGQVVEALIYSVDSDDALAALPALAHARRRAHPLAHDSVGAAFSRQKEVELPASASPVDNSDDVRTPLLSKQGTAAAAAPAAGAAATAAVVRCAAGARDAQCSRGMGRAVVSPCSTGGGGDAACGGGGGGGIRVEQLGCASPGGTQLFSDLSFAVTPGHSVLVMGTTGCGKVRSLEGSAVGGHGCFVSAHRVVGRSPKVIV